MVLMKHILIMDYAHGNSFKQKNLVQGVSDYRISNGPKIGNLYVSFPCTELEMQSVQKVVNMVNVTNVCQLIDHKREYQNTLIKYALNVYCGPGTMMGTEDIKLSERKLNRKEGERLKGYLDYSVLSGKINVCTKYKCNYCYLCILQGDFKKGFIHKKGDI